MLVGAMSRLVPSRSRDRWLVVLAVVVVVLALSPLAGRADVSGQYRPLVPPDGLTTGCYPLPGDVELDFAYVLRTDGTVLDAGGLHRRVVVQLDQVSAADATASAEASFAAAGVGDDVRVRARDLDVPDDQVVRGVMVLDLPVVARQLDDAVCFDANSTKRFTPDLPDRS